MIAATAHSVAVKGRRLWPTVQSLTASLAGDNGASRPAASYRHEPLPVLPGILSI